ncbi:hypothetical protein STCU_11648 [Strigomonas culicis]|uniref:Uncharacterized protein n=1 Tax=Strigomonas culicis TaxID=28005 RepID=S9UZG7_9TRYP|nr:hypothetical protein STCU_11648 [Strigomonas culicis]|eukprot:EPY15950.1 hypothetical protein STCU_11648 [Strigomonas culicis]
MRENEEQEKLQKESSRLVTAKTAKRDRGAQDDMGYDDDKHGFKDFAATRFRKENEKVFEMTKEKQRKSLWAKRREAKKK